MSEAKETHVHVLEDGTTIEHSHGEHGSSSQPCPDQGGSEPAFQGDRTSGIDQAYGGGRQRLF